MTIRLRCLTGCILLLCVVPPVCSQREHPPCRLPVRVTSKIALPRVPLDPTIDFGARIEQADLPGVLDPNSIVVLDVAAGAVVPHALEGFAFSDKGLVQWVITDPSHTEYEIRFSTAAVRPPLRPAQHTPLIGVGDLLRYNAGEGRPLAPTRCMSGLADITGDGKPDLVGVWSYSHRPGMPWHSMVVWPRVGGPDEFRFGDMAAVPSLPAKPYCAADVCDVNGDGLQDVVHAKVFHGNGTTTLAVYLNSSAAGVGGLADFLHSANLPTQTIQWHSLRCVDLNADGALDLVMTDDGRYVASSTNYFLRNANPDGWPFNLADAVPLDIAGFKATFFDVDGDELLDAVSLVETPDPRGLSDYRVAWQRNLGGGVIRFGPIQQIAEINARITRPRDLLSVEDGDRGGLLVVYEDKQRTAFFEDVSTREAPRFRHFADAECESTVVCLSDQAAPRIVDWEGDGDWDLLVGGGYGWPRIVVNEGARQRPALGEAQPILSEGEPIRILREEVLGTPGHGHNMGYPYPAYVDWDADGLPDLVVPNETNRILWYKNVGTRAAPEFGPQQEVICDDYPDSRERRNQTRLLTIDPDLSCYPAEDWPFPWRCGAGFADFDGDGLTDMVTTSGVPPRAATLFSRYRDEEGRLRLRRDRVLRTVNGGTFSASRYECVDWDGDGDIDIVTSVSTPKVQDTIFLARNVGTNEGPIFEYAPLRCFGDQLYITRHGPKVGVADIDADGLPDLLASTEWSVYPFYCHAALSMKERPKVELGNLVRTPPERGGAR